MEIILDLNSTWNQRFPRFPSPPSLIWADVTRFCQKGKKRKRQKDKKTKRQRTKRRKDSACWGDVTKVFGFELELIEQDANKVQTSSNNS